MKKTNLLLMLVYMISIHLSHAQITFSKYYKTGSNIIKSTGLFSASHSDEIIMTTSNYTQGNCSVFLLDRNGVEKCHLTLNLNNTTGERKYQYIYDVIMKGDTIYGCGTSARDSIESKCMNVQVRGFYFKGVIDRSNLSNIKARVIWIKEDVLNQTNQGSYYSKVIIKNSDTLIVGGAIYTTSYDGCNGKAITTLLFVNPVNGAVVDPLNYTGVANINFTALTDITQDANTHFYVQNWDWRINAVEKSYMNILKLSYNGFNILDSAHYKGYDSIGVSINGNATLRKSLISDGDYLYTGIVSGYDSWHPDKTIAICKIKKSDLTVDKQINIKISSPVILGSTAANNYGLKFGQLIKHGNNYILFYCTNNLAIIRFVYLDANLNILKTFNLSNSLFANVSVSNSSNPILVINNDIYVYVNRFNRIELHRLDLSNATEVCKNLEQITIDHTNYISQREDSILLRQKVYFPNISKDTTDTYLDTTLNCLTCHLLVSIEKEDTLCTDSLKLTANTNASFENLSYEWYNASNVLIGTKKSIKVSSNGMYKVKVKEKYFLCEASDSMMVSFEKCMNVCDSIEISLGSDASDHHGPCAFHLNYRNSLSAVQKIEITSSIDPGFSLQHMMSAFSMSSIANGYRIVKTGGGSLPVNAINDMAAIVSNQQGINQYIVSYFIDSNNICYDTLKIVCNQDPRSCVSLVSSTYVCDIDSSTNEPFVYYSVNICNRTPGYNIDSITLLGVSSNMSNIYKGIKLVTPLGYNNCNTYVFKIPISQFNGQHVSLALQFHGMKGGADYCCLLNFEDSIACQNCFEFELIRLEENSPTDHLATIVITNYSSHKMNKLFLYPINNPGLTISPNPVILSPELLPNQSQTITINLIGPIAFPLHFKVIAKDDTIFPSGLIGTLFCCSGFGNITNPIDTIVQPEECPDCDPETDMNKLDWILQNTIVNIADCFVQINFPVDTLLEDSNCVMLSIDWGDGSAIELVHGGLHNHWYHLPGQYLLTIRIQKYNSAGELCAEDFIIYIVNCLDPIMHPFVSIMNNPISDYLKLFTNQRPNSIALQSMDGGIQKSIQVNESFISGEINISVADLPAGVYHVLVDFDKERVIKRIIKK